MDHIVHVHVHGAANFFFFLIIIESMVQPTCFLSLFGKVVFIYLFFILLHKNVEKFFKILI
jgi:hypothetical protein